MARIITHFLGHLRLISIAALVLITGAFALPHAPVAAASPIYSWSTVGALGNGTWSALGVSANGSVILAGAYSSSTDSQSYLFLSTDHGATWTKTANDILSQWSGAAVSDDGQTLVATQNSDSSWNPGNIYISHDGGTTWAAASGVAPGKWVAVAISGDGSVLSAVQNSASEQIYTSIDSGTTWTAAPHTAIWNGVAVSGDGSTIVAAPEYDPSYNTDYLYLSTNKGATWSPITTIGSRADAYWAGASLSNDGQTIVAANGHEGGSFATGSVYISHDGGATWTKTNAVSGDFSSISMSGNGQIILAAQWGLDQYDTQPGITELSTDGGVTWSQVPITPNQNFYNTALSRDGSKLIVGANTLDGVSGTYGHIYIGTLLIPPLTPQIDPIHTGDKVLTGTTSPQATVTAHFTNYSISASDDADIVGKFAIAVPQSITLTKSDVINFDATSPDGATSAITKAVVAQTPTNPTPTSPDTTVLANTGENWWYPAFLALGGIVIGCIAVIFGSTKYDSRRSH